MGSGYGRSMVEVFKSQRCNPVPQVAYSPVSSLCGQKMLTIAAMFPLRSNHHFFRGVVLTRRSWFLLLKCLLVPKGSCN